MYILFVQIILNNHYGSYFLWQKIGLGASVSYGHISSSYCIERVAVQCNFVGVCPV